MRSERRLHPRFVIDGELVFQFNNDYYPCDARNISQKGALVRLKNATHSLSESTQEGMCWLDYCGIEFESRCKIIRVAGNDVAILFLEPDSVNIDSLQWIITENIHQRK